jgi:hypothetical protein
VKLRRIPEPTRGGEVLVADPVQLHHPTGIVVAHQDADLLRGVIGQPLKDGDPLLADIPGAPLRWGLEVEVVPDGQQTDLREQAIGIAETMMRTQGRKEATVSGLGISDGECAHCGR